MFKTDQERFWAGEFGQGYMERNEGERWVASNQALFSRILHSAPGVRSIAELGCNIGLNLQALHRINPQFDLCGYEINVTAAARCRELGIAKIVEGTILEPLTGQFDLTFTKGVLIHINPNELRSAYDNLYQLSTRYVLVAEYYSPTPEAITYRGVPDRLFKRDFAGEIMDLYGVELVDYGFVYRRDNYFLQGDISWFLLQK